MTNADLYSSLYLFLQKSNNKLKRESNENTLIFHVLVSKVSRQDEVNKSRRKMKAGDLSKCDKNSSSFGENVIQKLRLTQFTGNSGRTITKQAEVHYTYLKNSTNL